MNINQFCDNFEISYVNSENRCEYENCAILGYYAASRGNFPPVPAVFGVWFVCGGSGITSTHRVITQKCAVLINFAVET